MKFSTSEYSNINRTWFLVLSKITGEWSVHQGTEFTQCECEETRQLVQQAYNDLMIGENEQNLGMIRVFDLEDDINFLRNFLLSRPNIYNGFHPEIEEGLYWCFCTDGITPTPVCDPLDKRQILSAISRCFMRYDSDLAAKTRKVLLKRSPMSAGSIVHYDRAYD